MMTRRAASRLGLVAFLLVAGLAAGLGVRPAFATESFVKGFDELPLMPGLYSVVEDSLIFDKPSGGIVQAEARGAVAVAAVRKFYGETVPQYGWRVGDGPDRFVRDGEALHLDFAPAPADAAGRPQFTVRFLLSPE